MAGIIETIAGTEPTPREISQIILTVRNEKIDVILVHPQHSSRPAELVSESTNCKIIKVDPLGGTPGRESYEEIIFYNAEIILEAFQ